MLGVGASRPQAMSVLIATNAIARRRFETIVGSLSVVGLPVRQRAPSLGVHVSPRYGLTKACAMR